MGLFASDKKTIRVYFDEHGNITETETPDWVDVLAELPYSLNEQFLRGMKAQINPDGTYSIELGRLMFEADFFAKVIKAWSAEVPITVENVKKLHARILDNLATKLRELYGLSRPSGAPKQESETKSNEENAT